MSGEPKNGRKTKTTFGSHTTGSALALALVLWGGAARADALLSADFRSSLSGWEGERALEVTLAPAAKAPGQPISARHALQMPVSFPGVNAFMLRRQMNWSSASRLQMNVLVEAPVSGEVQVRPYVRDLDGRLYLAGKTFAAKPGKWTPITVSASPAAGGWVPEGHAQPWGAAAARRLNEVGVRLTSPADGSGEAFLDDVRLTRSSVGSGDVAPTDMLSFDFEDTIDGWAGVALLDAGLKPPPADSRRPGNAARLPLRFPGSADFVLRRRMDWREASRLQFDLYLPPEARKRVQAIVYVRDLDGLWYQTSDVYRPEGGGWSTISVDASPQSIGWETRGHLKPWCGYAVQFLDEVALRLFSDERVQADAFIGRVELTRGPDNADAPLQVLNFTTSDEVTPRYGLFEMTFELSRCYNNPFDPDDVDIRAVFVAPSGMVQIVPGFFYQDFVRNVEEKTETLTPIGRPVWKVRYSPQEEGRHRYYLEVREDKGRKVRRFFESDGDPSRERSVQCVPSDNSGYVRVCAKDPRYFEFDNGDFYYPIGHNIPATYNVKNAGALGLTIHKLEGTFAYDRFLDGMGRGEENFARIWLASWSFGLEWSRIYSWEYRDLGRYNMRNAWRFDYVLDGCARRDIYVQLALTTFGHYRSEEFEGDWPYSPYNSELGGPVPNPSDFWTSQVCQKYYRRMLRYVMARWGYSTHVMSWEISNEIDLVTNYTMERQNIIEWHRECVKALREFDQGHHMVTTNFAVWEREPLILSLPEISYSSTNRYERDIVEKLKDIYANKSQFGKPAFMAECGDDFKGSDAQTTERYIPICLWSVYMMPFGGGGTQWWWDFIDDRDLYYYFKGISRFAQGEDRRGKGLEMRTAAAVHLPEGKADSEVGVECLAGNSLAYFWVYETKLLHPDIPWQPAPRRDLGVKLTNLKDGKYTVEWWDTMAGEVIRTNEVEAKGGVLVAPAPEFINDVAAKVKPAAVPSKGSEKTREAAN